MEEEQQTPAPEVGDDATPEAVENTEGQEKDPPAEAEAAEAADGDEPEAKETPSAAKQRRERRKARMEQLRQEAEDAERRAAEAEKRLQEIERARGSRQPPKEADFQDYQEYLVALGAYHAETALDSREADRIKREGEGYKERAQGISQEAQREAIENWQAQADEARTRYADFDAVTMNPRVPITETMVEIIQSSDLGADVAYYLGTNTAEAALISRMKPLEAARAIGAIEARLSTPRPRTQSAAPEPIRPVKPKATAAPDPSKMTMAEYKKWRMSQSA